MKSKVDRKQQMEARQALARAAANAELRLPGAFRLLRKALDMNQETFGRLFKMTRRQVSELENGMGDPKVSTLTRIARVYGMEVGLVPSHDKAIVTGRDGEPANLA